MRIFLFFSEIKEYLYFILVAFRKEKYRITIHKKLRIKENMLKIKNTNE